MTTVLNIAHRGYTRVFPDNTCESLQAAIDAGFDGVEFDVRETADYRFIVYHDPKLRGRDVRKWIFSGIEEVRLEERFAIPSLEDVLDLCRGKVKLVIELKQITSLEKLFSILNERANPDDIIIASFKPRLVKPFSLLSPRLPTALITASGFPDPVRRARLARCSSLVARFPLVDEALMEKARSGNLEVFVWGCLDVTEIQKVLEFPIAGIISNVPDLVREQLSGNV
jgi:glycerophosphoryl diester phosphodiesterase